MKRKYILLCILVAMAIVCVSCNRQQKASQKEDATPAATSQDSLRELPLPEVPTTLTAPEERAAYILLHYWDAMDFRDTLRSHDRMFLEQNFVNYLSLFPHAKGESLSPAIDALLERAVVDTVALSLVNDIAEQYLDEPNSPMRNEEYYILYLEGLLRLPGLSKEARIRPAYQLEMARKNRPGTVATDFSCTDRNGKRRTLHGTHGERILLVFYDPACSHCTDILKSLYESPLLSKLIADKELTVLAVYTEGDRQLWEETKDSMPQEWIVTIDESRIVERNLYSLPAMPVIYLLDSNKKVLLKDPTQTTVEAYLNG